MCILTRIWYLSKHIYVCFGTYMMKGLRTYMCLYARIWSGPGHVYVEYNTYMVWSAAHICVPRHVYVHFDTYLSIIFHVLVFTNMTYNMMFNMFIMCITTIKLTILWILCLILRSRYYKKENSLPYYGYYILNPDSFSLSRPVTRFSIRSIVRFAFI